MAFAEPRNSPTPIVPPMAMSWMCRLCRFRERFDSARDMRALKIPQPEGDGLAVRRNLTVAPGKLSDPVVSVGSERRAGQAVRSGARGESHSAAPRMRLPAP